MGKENAMAIGQLGQDIAAEDSASIESGPCPSCAHDYGGLCPKGWDLKNGGGCAAPDSYSGPCAGSVLLDEMSALDKAHFELRCLVCWPCSGVLPEKVMGGGSEGLTTTPLFLQNGPIDALTGGVMSQS